jgi:Zn-dependent protease/predicted transcriptional regulator
MRSTIRFGKIFGIPVGINSSWFLVIALITFLLQSQFSLEFPRWTLVQTWSLAGVTGLLFFGSVLAHELAHSVVATARGIPVRGITLFVFGGVSNISHEAKRPWVEFIIAFAGPLLSMVLGGVLLGVSWVMFPLNDSIYIAALTLGWTNLALGIFNLLPGFPLDGGRVLRAIIWGTTGNYHVATNIAARIGQGLAVSIILGSVIWFILSGELLRLWPLLIGMFLFSAATSALSEVRERQRYRDVTAKHVALASCTAVDCSILLSEVVERHVLGQGQTCFLVCDGEAPVGIVPLKIIRDMPKAGWITTTLGQVMATLDELPEMEQDTDVSELLDVFEDDNPPIAILLSSDNGIVGAVTPLDIDRYMKTRRDLGM